MVTNQYDNPSVYAGWRSVKLSGSGTRLIAKAVGQKNASETNERDIELKNLVTSRKGGLYMEARWRARGTR
jgi:hypothetical protein